MDPVGIGPFHRSERVQHGDPVPVPVDVLLFPQARSPRLDDFFRLGAVELLPFHRSQIGPTQWQILAVVTDQAQEAVVGGDDLTAGRTDGHADDVRLEQPPQIRLAALLVSLEELVALTVREHGERIPDLGGVELLRGEVR